MKWRRDGTVHKWFRHMPWVQMKVYEGSMGKAGADNPTIEIQAISY